MLKYPNVDARKAKVEPVAKTDFHQSHSSGIKT